MRIFRGWEQVPTEARGASVAVGNFDGVHLGHRAVIERARALAAECRAALGVVTFEPHPREVLDPARAPARLTPFARKAELLRDLGVERLYVLRFGPALMRLSPEAFVGEILVRHLGIAAMVTGEDFRFGHRRAGDVALLRELASRHGFVFDAVGKVEVEGAVCSSTRIREALLAGEVAAASRLLGYAYELRGGVIGGDRLGRKLGYPTANVRPAGRKPLLPALGIYAVRAAVFRHRQWQWHPAVASLGTRPTFGGVDTRLEVHLLDGSHQLYGCRMRVAFVERLRAERAFDSTEALIAEMARDCARARAIHGLAHAS